MKCPKCNGTGEMQICEMGFIGKDECDKCHGKGYLNEEEWLHTLNTEQLAEVFFDYRYVNATPQQQLWLSANEDFVRGGIAEWLKQPHTVKE